MLRRDARKLGKVAESAFAEKLLKESRTVFDAGDEGMIKKGRANKAAAAVAGIAGLAEDEEEVGDGEGEGRKRKKRKVEEK